MDMKETPTGDVTFYMLLEATGDSEADCDSNKGEYANEIYTADDDDAESCSYDNESETCDAAELNGYDDESLNADEDDQKKDGVNCGTSYCEDDEMQEEHLKSCVSDDSSQELMDEMEKNRLFWEACLAS